MILFNSVLENNYKIKIIFLIKFQEKWKKYLEILKLDMEKVKICYNSWIKHNTYLFKVRKNKNREIKIRIIRNK